MDGVIKQLLILSGIARGGIKCEVGKYFWLNNIKVILVKVKLPNNAVGADSWSSVLIRKI